jgi:uncharacterized protein YuzE
MKLTYDPRYNIAYLRLAQKDSLVQTVHLSEELNVDLGPDGKVYGIELLNANQQLGVLVGGKLIVENEATGKEQEILLA